MRKIHFYIGVFAVCFLVMLIRNIRDFGALLGILSTILMFGILISLSFLLDWIDTKLKD